MGDNFRGFLKFMQNYGFSLSLEGFAKLIFYENANHLLPAENADIWFIKESFKRII